jgi:sec-independent protein translocase protein TatA
MLGLDNPLHIAFLLVLLLLVFGAKRLPEMGKSLGSGLRGFKDSLSGDEPAPGEPSPTPRDATPALTDAPIVPQPRNASTETEDRVPETAGAAR